MTVRLELTPETEASLSEQAKARGVPLDAYLQHVIEDLVRSQAVSNRGVEEFRAALDKLAEMGKSLPHLPLSVFSRESIYSLGPQLRRRVFFLAETNIDSHPQPRQELPQRGHINLRGLPSQVIRMANHLRRLHLPRPVEIEWMQIDVDRVAGSPRGPVISPVVVYSVPSPHWMLGEPAVRINKSSASVWTCAIEISSSSLPNR